MESKLNRAWVIMDIESSFSVCLFCPPGVLQINPQLKCSVVSIALSWNGDWVMRPNTICDGLILKLARGRDEEDGALVYAVAVW